MFGFEPLVFWGWTFLVMYIGMMLLFGFVGMSRVKDSDDFATARGGYGPLFLAFAMTATTATGWVTTSRVTCSTIITLRR